MNGSNQDRDGLSERHVHVDEVMAAKLRQRSERLAGSRALSPVAMLTESTLHLFRMPSNDRHVPAARRELRRSVTDVTLDTGEVAGGDNVNNSRHFCYASTNADAERRGPRR
jgi:hypothetical protein